jgi:AbrB family looped-hinge helix DNA binding protein
MALFELPVSLMHQYPAARAKVKEGFTGRLRMRQVQRETERRLNRFRNIGFLGILGLIVTLLGIMLGIILPILYKRVGNIADATVAEMKTELRALRDQVREQKIQIETLNARGTQPKSMKIGERGQVTIPKDIREQFGLGSETEVEFRVVGGSIVLRKAPNRLNLAKWKGRCGDAFTKLGYSSADTLIDDVRGRRSQPSPPISARHSPSQRGFLRGVGGCTSGCGTGPGLLSQPVSVA